MDDLDRKLKAAFGGQAAEEASHPEVEELAAYAAGELAPSAAEHLQEHLVWCRECTGLLLAHSELAPERTADSETQAEKAWRQIQDEHSREEPAPVLDFRAPTRATATWRPRLWAAAAVLFLASTATLSWRLAELTRTVDDLRRPQGNVLVRDLYATDVLRDGGANAVIAPGQAFVTLILNATEPRYHAEYLVEVRDASDREIWSLRGLEKSPYDTFILVLPRGALEPGKYRLVLFGVDGEQKTSIEEFPLRLDAGD